MNDQQTTIQVTGMTCGHCVRHVTEALDGVPGVRASTVDLAGGTATIRHDATTSRAAIVAAVVDAGYDVSEP